MPKEELKLRTKKFALRVLKLASALPNSQECYIIRGQLIRCGTSVASNYRASCRARSKSDFIAKLGIVEEEADETGFWLEVIIERNHLKKELVQALLNETYELLAITVSSIKTAKKNN